MSKFKIETNVPIPAVPHGGGSKPIYPFAEMSVGDSFAVPDKTRAMFSGTVAAAKKRTKFVFVSRDIDGGVRVWRKA
jgi:hypothetical protein